jgi:hypothetical protein
MSVVVPAREKGGYDLTSHHHAGCFRLPRKFVSGPTQLSPEDFFREMVTDTTDGGDILPAKIDELVEKMEAASSGTKGGSKDNKKNTIDTSTLMGRLKQALKDEEAGNEKPAKKQKKGRGEESFEKLLELYSDHHKSKADDLKDYLRYVSDCGFTVEWTMKECC